MSVVSSLARPSRSPGVVLWPSGIPELLVYSACRFMMCPWRGEQGERFKRNR